MLFVFVPILTAPATVAAQSGGRSTSTAPSATAPSTAAPGASLSIGIADYVTRYVAGSSNLRNAQTALDKARDQYERAQTIEVSGYDFALLTNEYQFRLAQVQTTTNGEALAAVQRLFAYLSAQKAVETTAIVEGIRATEARRDAEFYERGVITIQALRSAQSNHLTAQSEQSNAGAQLRNARNAVLRPIGATATNVVVAAFTPVPLEIAAFDLAAFVANDATLQKLRADLSQYEQRLTYLTGSSLVARTEIDSVTETIETTRIAVQQRQWALEDDWLRLTTTIQNNQRATAIAEIAKEMRQTDLLAARHRFEREEIQRIDLTSAELNFANAAERIVTLQRDRLLLELELAMKAGVSLPEWLAEGRIVR